MTQKEESNGVNWLPLVILLVLTLAGGVFGTFLSNGNGFDGGLFLGFLIGIACITDRRICIEQDPEKLNLVGP